MSALNKQPTRISLPFSEKKLDRRAVEIVSTLQRAGFESYLVGGCVRDLLLGLQPKDFDIATAARPEKIRRLFRRSRIIGRRFKIVHVLSGRETYEVSTFRKAPKEHQPGKETLAPDNAYGTPREDALRRDFGVNALFLDPVDKSILDWAGGLQDLEERVLKSIGEPQQRFTEDPVRILRLIKFMRRSDLQPSDADIVAARQKIALLGKAAAPRLVEEMFRLLITGDSAGVFEDLKALNALRWLLPDLHTWLQRGGDRPLQLEGRLQALDGEVRRGMQPSYAMRLAVLYGPYVEEELDPDRRTLPVREFTQVATEIFRQLQIRARLPRHELVRAGRILTAQIRMDPPPWSRHQAPRKKDARWLLDQEWRDEAIRYLGLRLMADKRDLKMHRDWEERALSFKAGDR